ncbi:uncharacterized protein B0I36DRAFT_354271 [Microdochium trichocladiopsis]|uniref:Uncharacterized protein n=1 Tax=Microdochium trichocladiopsis TaxID=1682393 RepID=A0A9P9BKV9_9PEZI|nr:uncharacterized protein B0I36DRAFT_354271 [Microdochium trichocladiopsis]KAH7021659.1 hypothetical protein B0I36DRAFT_354271 [Microdochium trichocladiopsis]
MDFGTQLLLLLTHYLLGLLCGLVLLNLHLDGHGFGDEGWHRGRARILRKQPGGVCAVPGSKDISMTFSSQCPVLQSLVLRIFSRSAWLPECGRNTIATPATVCHTFSGIGSRRNTGIIRNSRWVKKEKTMKCSVERAGLWVMARRHAASTEGGIHDCGVPCSAKNGHNIIDDDLGGPLAEIVARRLYT